MSKKKIWLISGLSVAVLAIVAVVLVIVLSSGKDDDTDRGDKGGDKQTTPYVSDEKNPLEEVEIGNSVLKGSYKFSECLDKSKESPLVFYLLEDKPKKDADVEAVIVFCEGGVVVFDQSAIAGKYSDRTIGNILKVKPTELIEELTAERKKQTLEAAQSFFEMYPKIAVQIGLTAKGIEPDGSEYDFKVSELAIHANREEPIALKYDLIIRTDDSGNNVESETLYIPQAWKSNVLLDQDEDEAMVAVEFPMDENAMRYDILITGETVEDVTDSKAMAEWKENYDELTEYWQEYVGKDRNSKYEYSFLNSWEVDITTSLSGEIYESSYVGFPVAGQKSLITVCTPGTTISMDKPADVSDKGYAYVDPKPEKELVLLYRRIQSMAEAVAPVETVKSVAQYLESYLNAELAEKLLQQNQTKLAFALMNSLGMKEEIKDYKYKRAQELLKSGYDYDLAYEYLEDSGHPEEIAANKTQRAREILENTGLTEADDVYEEAYALLREAGNEDEIRQNQYERAGRLRSIGDYERACRLYKVSGHADEEEQCRIEQVKYLMDYGCYDEAYQLIEKIGQGDEAAALKYELACKKIDDGDYESAKTLLEGLNYQDSERLYQTCLANLQKQEEPPRDLNGLQVIIGDWWSGDNWEFPRNNVNQEITADWQEEMMQKHHYTVTRKTVYGWGDQAETAILSITNNAPLAQIMVLDYRFLGSFMDSEHPLFADVSKLDEFDFSDEKWNKYVVDSMTVGTAIYGFATEYEPRTGIYFNQDLLERLLGSEWRERPYDLQASGDWTWDAFDSLCAMLVEAGDTDNDGVTDIYPLLIQNSVFAEMAMASDNCHAIVTKNADGKYVNNCRNPEIIDDLSWAYSYYARGYARAALENEQSWDFYEDRWKEQKCVMIAHDVYRAEYFISREYDTGAPVFDFEWGFVCFPKKTKDSDYQPVARENVYAIPYCDATASTLADIAFVYNIFTDKAPGVREDQNYWISGYEIWFKDARAVSETLSIMINGRTGPFVNPAYIIPGLYDNSVGLIQSAIYYNFDGDIAPEQLLDSMYEKIQEKVDFMNARVK